MAIDNVQPIAQDVPSEQRVFARQNLFTSIYKPPQSDTVNVNLYQDFAYASIAGEGSFLMTTGANIVLDHVFEFGPFCTYTPNQNIEINSDDLKSDLVLNSYFYCGTMFAYTPIANKIFHPRLFLDLAMGNTHGSAITKNTRIVSPVNYVFMVIKPAVSLDINLWSFLQWSTAIQYRFQVNIGGPSNDMGSKASGVEISTGPVFQL